MSTMAAPALLSKLRGHQWLSRSLNSVLRTQRALHTSACTQQISVDLPEMEGAPKARDEEVKVTFVNYKGERDTLTGRKGWTISQIAAENNYEYLHVACRGPSMPFRYHKQGDWFEPTYGEGPYCAGCHVIIPKAAEAHCPPMQDTEAGRLEEYPFKEDMTETSRLGCCVPVTKDMDGMLVYVPDNEDLDIP